MASPSNSARSEFIRYVYRKASPATEDGRNTFLDTLAETAMGMQLKGKTLTGSSDKGTSASYVMLEKWGPEYSLDLIAWTRQWMTYSTAALAITAMEAAPFDSLATSRVICRQY